MKTADGAARDGDETEREKFPGKHGAVAVHEARQRRHLQGRAHEDHADGQRGDRTQLDERAQVIARRQQQPDRQRGGGIAIDNNRDGQRGA